MTTNANIYTEASAESIEILIMTPNTAIKPCQVTTRVDCYSTKHPILKILLLPWQHMKQKKKSEK